MTSTPGTVRSGMVLAALLSALSAHVFAQEKLTTPENDSVPAATAEESTTVRPAPVPPEISDQDPVVDYLQAIEEAESEHGAYAVELVDLYHGLGSYLLETDDLEGARDAFHRTVMVARVNFGLKSLDQSNYLYGVAEIESRLGNAPAAINVLDNVYKLHAEHYGPGNPAMLPEVTKIHDWYLEKRPLQGEGVRAADYENLTFLAWKIASLTEAQYGLGHRETAMRYRGLGQLHFRALHHLLQTGELVNTSLVLASAEPGEMFAQRAPRRHFRGGEMAFTLAAEAWLDMADATELQRAEAVAQLGDWFLAVQNFNDAHEQYGRAYQLLINGAEPAPMIEKYLHDPAPLRFLATENTFVRELDLPPGPKLAVSMSVTRNGLLSHIEFLNPPGESQEQLNGLRNQLKNTRFRPAIIEGKAEKIDGYVWNIPLKRQLGSEQHLEPEVPE